MRAAAHRWLLSAGMYVGFAAVTLAPSGMRGEEAIPLADALTRLVEREWIEDDRRFDAQRPFSLDHSRRQLEAAEALLDRLVRAASIPGEAALRRGLQESADALDNLERPPGATAAAAEPQRRELYFAIRRLKRKIAFANPRLDIPRLLLIKRHHPDGPFHMVDQFYGCNARPGGGLYVLHDPFGERPQLADLLESSVVERGRLAGQRLAGGAFLSPEVSFDGKTILFAWSQALAKETYQWKPEYCFHLFRVAADGTGLEQLTDGPFDDFDPCFLPGGRIAFVSTRRGGYLRCGRHCPTYTLFWMEPDGSDILPLSYHETHEWQPSVTHDGMIAYTRWDYVDRDTNVAHHIWLCYPDGRDPRSFHGNYPQRRESRPWMEMDIRAVPGSHKFVATAAAHHGNAFGSLVLIDQRLEDDGAMAQLTRLTPDCPFPESEGGVGNIARFMQYGTPWPLSETDFLCAYAADAKNHGIYWIDAAGNRELIYLDETIPSISPMPLAPRPQPPVIAPATLQTARARTEAGLRPEDEPAATIAVTNVYDSDFEWPEGAKITALRVIQVLPKTTPPPNVPRIGVAEQTNARAVLGTVPVERDGSAYFQAPAGKLLYFQAIDEEGMAVQSMRSGTYVMPGSHLVCQGCHEAKHRPPQPSAAPPLALRRPPSRLKPEAEGSNPFNYVRLVQPVLDRHCVSCHRERDAIDLGGEPTSPHGFAQSYVALAGKYGFYFHVTNGAINHPVHGGSRTTAGKFGARAARLTAYLSPDHYGVTLTDAERRRILLWLDCNSEFYGAYHDTERQARGELVLPIMD